VEASFTNGYAVLLVTALDGLPIAESHRMLVTAIARERPAGASYTADDTQLLTVGGPPLLMEPVEATLRIPGVEAVTALDVDGWPRVAVPVTDGAFAIDGRWRTLWYLAERPGADDTGVADDTGDTDATDDTNATDGGTDDTDGTEGCGCATPGAPGAPLALALGALAMVRRRRGAPPSPSRGTPSPRRHSNGG
jgi:MYXO-CTERM domain-containing protein